MNIDSTITLSVVIAFCTVISPIITTALNNAHQTKLKKMEYAQRKYYDTIVRTRTIFEDYLRYTGAFIRSYNAETAKDYGNAYGLALMYAPPQIQSHISSINSLLFNEEHQAASTQLEELAPMIHTMLQNM